MSTYMKVRLIVLGIMLAAAIISIPMGGYIGGGIST